jgi:hypothetical protein
MMHIIAGSQFDTLPELLEALIVIGKDAARLGVKGPEVFVHGKVELVEDVLTDGSSVYNVVVSGAK